MQIAGYVKNSFVDFPRTICAVVFTPYCNMRCPYCHNAHILDGDIRLYDEDEVFAHLEKRRDLLQGVTITGGEPTLQPDLPRFISRVRDMGYRVKLDTNGTHPEILRELMQAGLLDYVAMDVKAPMRRYSEIAGAAVNTDVILESIALLKNSGTDYELRTTFDPRLTKDDIVEIARCVRDAKLYALQQYRPRSNDDPPAHTEEYFRDTAKAVAGIVNALEIRGV